MSLGERVISVYYGATAILSDIALSAQPGISQLSPSDVLRLESFFSKANVLLDYAISALSVEEVFETGSRLLMILNDEFSILEQYLTGERIEEFKSLMQHDDWMHQDPLASEGRIYIPLSDEIEFNLLKMVEGRRETSDDLDRIISLIKDLNTGHKIECSFSYPPVLSQWNQLALKVSNEESWAPKHFELSLKGSSMSLSQEQVSLNLDDNNKAQLRIEFFPESMEGKEILLKLNDHQFAIRTGTPVEKQRFWFDLQKECTIRIC